MVVPEALASGMPVVTTTKMQSGVTIGEGHAPVVSLLPPGDASALKQQIEWWLNHRKELRQHRVDAQRLARPFDAEVGAARFSELAKGALEQA